MESTSPPGGIQRANAIFFINLFREKHQLAILKNVILCGQFLKLRKRLTTPVFSSQNFGKLINFATLGLRSSVREKENVDVNKLLRNSEGKRNKYHTTAKFPRTRNDSRAEGLTR